MTRKRVAMIGASLLAMAAVSGAQAAAEHPKGATALCKDGAFDSSKDQASACKSNGGVQEWWGTVAAPKDVPDAQREPNDRAGRPKDVTPAAGAGNGSGKATGTVTKP